MQLMDAVLVSERSEVEAASNESCRVKSTHPAASRMTGNVEQTGVFAEHGFQGFTARSIFCFYSVSVFASVSR